MAVWGASHLAFSRWHDNAVLGANFNVFVSRIAETNELKARGVDAVYAGLEEVCGRVNL
jgi:hypothetical protein